MTVNAERGFRVVTFKQFKDMNISTIEPRPLVVFVNRREAFQPPKDSLEKTEKLKRLAKTDRFIDPYRKGEYEREYRRMVVYSGRALGELREMAMESKRRQVLMVNDKDRPDAAILVKMAERFMAEEVWK